MKTLGVSLIICVVISMCGGVAAGIYAALFLLGVGMILG